MKQSLILLTLVCYLQHSNAQLSDSLRRKRMDDLVIRAVKAESDCLFEKAIILIDSAIAIDNAQDFTYVIKSENLWMLGRYSEAATNYERAIVLNNDSSFLFGAHLILGILNEKAGLTRKAQAEYSKAIYLFETKKRPNDRPFEDINRTDYAIALCLSGNETAWKKILNESSHREELQKYVGKSRKEVLDIYFKEYGG